MIFTIAIAIGGPPIRGQSRPGDRQEMYPLDPEAVPRQNTVRGRKQPTGAAIALIDSSLVMGLRRESHCLRLCKGQYSGKKGRTIPTTRHMGPKTRSRHNGMIVFEKHTPASGSPHFGDHWSQVWGASTFYSLILPDPVL